MNGQKRHSLTDNPTPNRQPKDYRRVAVNFHGGEAAYEKAMEKIKGQHAS